SPRRIPPRNLPLKLAEAGIEGRVKCFPLSTIRILTASSHPPDTPCSTASAHGMHQFATILPPAREHTSPPQSHRSAKRDKPAPRPAALSSVLPRIPPVRIARHRDVPCEPVPRTNRDCTAPALTATHADMR